MRLTYALATSATEPPLFRMTRRAYPEGMNARGYMIEVTLDDEALRVEGTTKPARIALRGEDHGSGPLVIPRAQIASVEHKRANALVNGAVTVKTTEGSQYVLHFRKKSQDEFAALAAALS